MSHLTRYTLTGFMVKLGHIKTTTKKVPDLWQNEKLDFVQG